MNRDQESLTQAKSGNGIKKNLIASEEKLKKIQSEANHKLKDRDTTKEETLIGIKEVTAEIAETSTNHKALVVTETDKAIDHITTSQIKFQEVGTDAESLST